MKYANAALLNTLKWILRGNTKTKTINDLQIAQRKGKAVITFPMLLYYKRAVVYKDIAGAGIRK